MWTRQWLSTTGASRRVLHSSLAQRRERCALVHTFTATIAASTARDDVGAFRVGVVGLGAIGTIFFTRLGRLAAVPETREGLPTLYVDALVKAEQFDTWVKTKTKEETVRMEVVQDGRATETLDFQVLRTDNADKVATGCNVRVRALAGHCAGDTREDDDRLDVLLVTVKAHDSSDVVRALRAKYRHLLTRDALCVLLQNGLGDEAALAEAKADRLDDRWHFGSGVTFVGGRVLKFATVTASGLDMGKTYIAPSDGREGETQRRKTGDAVMTAMMQRDRDGKMQMLADVLVAAGLETLTSAWTPCQVLESDAMQATLWHKLIVNAAINPLASVLNAPNKSVARSASSRQCVRLVVQEALAVAQCEHILLDRTHNELADDVFEVARNTGSNVCSMLADLRRGARTEIDAITGRIVAGGKRHGIPTPTNESFLSLIKALEMEQGARRSR